MRLKVTHYRQQKDFDCGPATWKMVLGYFGIKVSLARLIRQLRTTKATGTTHREMVRLAGRYGLLADSKTGASITDLRRCLANGHPSVVNYIMPGWEVSHYAVVTGLVDNAILLHDPSEGAYYRIGLVEFQKRWYGWHRTVNRHWFMKISPKEPSARR